MSTNITNCALRRTPLEHALVLTGPAPDSDDYQAEGWLTADFDWRTRARAGILKAWLDHCMIYRLEPGTMTGRGITYIVSQPRLYAQAHMMAETFGFDLMDASTDVDFVRKARLGQIDFTLEIIIAKSIVMSEDERTLGIACV